MVKMDIIDLIIKHISKEDIILCKDIKGNWLHKDWCQLEYYENIYGCPRFHRECMYINDTIFDVGVEPFIIVGLKCNFKKYIEDMKELHPDWSLRKLKTVIYYQKNINKELKDLTIEKIKSLILKGYKNLDYMDKPEIYGIFIIAMMIKMGYEIELKPKNILWKINLIYGRKDRKGGYYISKDLKEYFK